jgi:FtsP/CotA-like multicopper oxidase with cupredoxin domain
MAPTFNVTLSGFMVRGQGLRWAIDGKTYPENPEIFNVHQGQLVKMQITNMNGMAHPMHLHGQKFIVLSRDGVLEKHFGWKDTVLVRGGETVDIVFRAEDKGDWVFHCHILEHARAGMLSIVRVN